MELSIEEKALEDAVEILNLLAIEVGEGGASKCAEMLLRARNSLWLRVHDMRHIRQEREICKGRSY